MRKYIGDGITLTGWGAVVSAVFVLAGCGGAASRAILEHPFPAKEKLVEVASAPPPSTEKAAASVGLAVESWKLAGPFPAVAGSTAYAGDDPFAKAVVKQLQARKSGLVMTENMQCYAREMGRFVASHQKLPQLDLQAFIAGRCGVVPVSPSVVYATASGPPPMDAAVKEVERSLQQLTGSHEVGVWMGSGEKGSVITAAFGAPKVKLASVQVVREGGPILRVKGRFLESTGWLRGYTSVGPLGSSLCKDTPRSSAVLPEFDLQCAVAPNDAYAVFDMVAGAPQAVLGHGSLTLVVPVGGEIPAIYTSIAVSGAPSAKAGLLAQLNAVRTNLGKGSLEEVPAQSHTASVLLPHFFAASADADRQKLELITLGLMAGWDVPGPIRDAHLVSFHGTRGDSAPSFLSELLFFPSTRNMLLDPEARRVAFASTQDRKTRAVLGLISTYSIFEPRDYKAIEAGLLDELDRQRRARGKKPVERVGGDETDRAFDPVMAKLARGAQSPTGGLKEVLDLYANKLRRSFQGQVYSTMVIEGWHPTFDGSLVELDGVAVAAKVGFFVGEGANWGQYVTYLVFMPVSDGTVTAEAPTRRVQTSAARSLSTVR